MSNMATVRVLLFSSLLFLGRKFYFIHFLSLFSYVLLRVLTTHFFYVRDVVTTNQTNKQKQTNYDERGGKNNRREYFLFLLVSKYSYL